MSLERTLAAFPTREWPACAWNIDVRYDDKRRAVTFTAHFHGPWNDKTKVYGVEEQFPTFDGAVQWLAARFNIRLENTDGR